MNDLISRQAAIDAVGNAFDRETILYSFVRKIAISALRNMPSAQPEIVRCKDCKYYTSMIPNKNTGICSLASRHLGDDGFCSEGEKKDDD